ncbi:SUMF1/EgtB/PvdO family nonheme iron enzyme, partial [Stieleria mannarensis]|uniref:SUMF1/EgtB/PvdO family nonheme iron enzyme n=1 Tax=Stieleria mannarensis TaxID=2755585 RepID=UPI001602CE78
MRFTVFILACLTLDATTLVYAEDFVPVPLQPYRMGASDDDLFARRSEKPSAMVELSGTLHVGVSEVTNRQFREFVEDTGYQTS